MQNLLNNNFVRKAYSAFTKLSDRAINLTRQTKRFIIMLLDAMIIIVSMYVASFLINNGCSADCQNGDLQKLTIVAVMTGLITFRLTALYSTIIRFANAELLASLFWSIISWTIFLHLLGVLFPEFYTPTNFLIVFAVICLIMMAAVRILFQIYYRWWFGIHQNNEKVLIYGAGKAGYDLALGLQASAAAKLVAFIDDSPRLWGSVLTGVKVYEPKNLGKLITERKVSTIFLAISKIDRDDRRKILENLSKFPVKVKTVPTLPEIINGKQIFDLREISELDLLGRDSIQPSDKLLIDPLDSKNILITGAGGSIGSELARQALENNAKTIVLYEISEFSLYNIERELVTIRSQLGFNTSIIPILASVLDEARLKRTIELFQIHTVFHAAAYKHVSLVEQNVVQGVLNNTIGSMRVARAAMQPGVERFVFVSTDKAVRPTNVMGASKRLAEICIQNFATQKDHADIPAFSIVRFGNVLGSSGSVVPLFREQIANGGPVTVTHPNVNRFFMSINEAASLVIQAGAIANGGEVFVLDMGKPVRIAKLAETMIKLSGLSVQSSDNPDGDIEILYTGLRPGEKLYEELLIGDNVLPTIHPKILSARESFLHSEELQQCIENIMQSIESDDALTLRSLLKKAVIEYQPDSNVVDWSEVIEQ